MPHNRFDCEAKLQSMFQFIVWNIWHCQYFQYISWSNYP